MNNIKYGILADPRSGGSFDLIFSLVEKSIFVFEMSNACGGCSLHWYAMDSSLLGRISLLQIERGLIEAYAVHSQLVKLRSGDPRYDINGFSLSCAGDVLLAPVNYDYEELRHVVDQLPGSRSLSEVFLLLGHGDHEMGLPLYRCVQSILLQWEAQRRMRVDAEVLTGTVRKSLTHISSDEDALNVLSKGLTRGI